MEIYCINERCAAFCIDSTERFSRKDAEELVKSLISTKKLESWETIHIDMFACGCRRLYLAYPDARLKISIAPYALPYISEYFTE